VNFTPKTEEQLQWDLLKAGVRAKVNLEVYEYRNRRVNEMLEELWPAFKAMLDGDSYPELDPEYANWILDAINGAAYTRELTS
jgi:hypothetical protein